MYTKKFLEEVIYLKGLESEYNSVIKIFKRLKEDENLEYIPIDYFFIYESMNKDNLYKLFHILLEYNVIESVEFIECEECGSESVYKDNGNNRCSRCQENLYGGHITENFRLVQGR